MSLKWDLFWLILKCVAHFSTALYLKDYKLFFLLYVHKYCLIILDLDRICWHICLLPFLKLLGFFFKIADESFSVMRDLTLKLQLGLAFFCFLFLFLTNLVNENNTAP